jgi:hypothetical protein
MGLLAPELALHVAQLPLHVTELQLHVAAAMGAWPHLYPYQGLVEPQHSRVREQLCSTEGAGCRLPADRSCTTVHWPMQHHATLWFD